MNNITKKMVKYNGKTRMDGKPTYTHRTCEKQEELVRTKRTTI